MKKVNSPWIGINLDTGNFHTNPYNQIEMCLPYAVNAQFKTLIAAPDGKAQPADWERIVRMFARSGYKGYPALEYEDEEAAETAFPRHMKNASGVGAALHLGVASPGFRVISCPTRSVGQQTKLNRSFS